MLFSRKSGRSVIVKRVLSAFCFFMFVHFFRRRASLILFDSINAPLVIFKFDFREFAGLEIKV